MKNLVLDIMLTMGTIKNKKELFKLPYRGDQLEYWGPVSNAFADSFLTMGHSFLYQNFDKLNSRTLKSIFSCFVEMVQNVAEYNEAVFKDNYPQSYLKLKEQEKGKISITTVNQILEKDLSSVKTIFDNVCSMNQEQLAAEYKKLLMQGGSLGLIMLNRLKGSIFEYNFSKDENGDNWLYLELKIDYGNT